MQTRPRGVMVPDVGSPQLWGLQKWGYPGQQPQPEAHTRQAGSPAHPFRAIGVDWVHMITHSLPGISTMSILKAVCVISDDSSPLAFQPYLAQCSLTHPDPELHLPARQSRDPTAAEPPAPPGTPQPLPHKADP